MLFLYGFLHIIFLRNQSRFRAIKGKTLFALPARFAVRQPAPRSVCPAAAAVSTICSMLIPGDKTNGYNSLPSRFAVRQPAPRFTARWPAPRSVCPAAAAVSTICAKPIPGGKAKGYSSLPARFTARWHAPAFPMICLMPIPGRDSVF